MTSIAGNYLVSLVKSGKVGSYVAIDSDDGMLYNTRSKAYRVEVGEGVQTQIAIMQRNLLDPLPLQDGVVDVVILNQVIISL